MTREPFRFLEFPVYNQIRVLIKLIFKITGKFSYKLSGSIGDHIDEAVVSVALNLAEGSAKKSDRDFNRFLNVCLGSLNEVIAGIDIAHELEAVSEEDFKQVLELAGSISRQFGGFGKSLTSQKLKVVSQ
jgi:four helix bundle protein